MNTFITVKAFKQQFNLLKVLVIVGFGICGKLAYYEMPFVDNNLLTLSINVINKIEWFSICGQNSVLWGHNSCVWNSKKLFSDLKKGIENNTKY